MRKTWETIKNVTNTHKRGESIPNFFRQNGEIIAGTAEIAEGFNTFFAGIGPKLASEIPESNKDFTEFMGPSSPDIFLFNTVTPEILSSIASKLKPKNSTGPDRISTKLMKEIIPVILSPLCHIVRTQEHKM